MSLPIRPLMRFSDMGLEFAASKVPGWGPGSRIDRLDRDIMTVGLPDSVMVTIYEQVPKSTCPYIPNVWDCENIARRSAVLVAEIWARLVNAGEAEGCLMQGAVMGRIPVYDQPAGNHCANYFWNDNGIYRMWEEQARVLLTPEQVAKTEATWKLEFH